MGVRLFQPSVGDAELAGVKDAFERAWLGLGPRVREFEARWSAFIGVRASVAVNSCTAALHLAVSAFRFPAGKKVLVPAVTFAATAMAPIYNRLEPVFVDVDERTGGIALDDLDRKTDRDCVAVIPVHFCGHPVPMDELVPWAHRRGLKVIEDCAHTAGGAYRGRMLGTWGDVGCFSFEEKKCLTTGDGGMLCADDADLLEPLRAARWVGINRDTWQRLAQDGPEARSGAYHWYYEIHDLGFKYNMNDLAASIGLAQLERLDAMNRRRSAVIERYLAGLADCRHVRPALPYRLENASYQMFMVRTARRDDLIGHLRAADIATGVHYLPLPLHPYFQRFAGEADIPAACRWWRQVVTLPLHAELTAGEVDRVIAAVGAFDRQVEG